MDYVIVGAGALGQSFAALLAGVGEGVTLFSTPRSAERLRAAGSIRLVGAVHANTPLGAGGVLLTSNAADLRKDTAVLFTTKGQDLTGAVDAVYSAIGRDVAWVGGVQNGVLKDDVLMRAFGRQRVLGTATIFGAARLDDGSVQVISPGATYVGELDGGLSDRARQAAATFAAAGIPTQARDDISSVLWSKACNAAGVFGVAVLARASNERLFSSPHLMRAYLMLVRETAQVAAAYGVKVGDYAGFPPIRTFVERDEQATLDLIDPSRAASSESYASMTRDVLDGRALEVDAVFGDIVDRADRKGVPVPGLRLTRDIIRGLDPGHNC
jgi:2-dehydropantoate 2-reductase